MTGVTERLSGRERVLAHLRNVVLCEPGMEGAFINEQTLAGQVGVSRTPVREALLILASEGLLQMVPQRGAYIPPLSGREIRELMDLRGVIEKHAAELVPARADSTAAAMQAVLEKQRVMAASPDQIGAKEFIELDRQFHQVMVDAAGSALLSRTYAALRERQIRVGIGALQAGHARWGNVCTEHAAIVAAVRAGDVAGTHESIDAHLKITLETLLAV